MWSPASLPRTLDRDIRQELYDDVCMKYSVFRLAPKNAKAAVVVVSVHGFSNGVLVNAS